MARNSSGTMSLPAGNPVVSGTTASSTVMNATLSDISTEITDSLSRSGKGPMTAPLELEDGDAAAPALCFDTDPDTGVYKAGTNELGFAAAGGAVGKMTATGLQMTVTPAASTTSIADRLTKMNIPKVWGVVSTDGGGGATVLAGFNVASVAIIGNSLIVNIAAPMASGDYAVLASAEEGAADNVVAHPGDRDPASFGIKVRTTANASVTLASSSVTIHFVVFGAQ